MRVDFDLRLNGVVRGEEIKCALNDLTNTFNCTVTVGLGYVRNMIRYYLICCDFHDPPFGFTITANGDRLIERGKAYHTLTVHSWDSKEMSFDVQLADVEGSVFLLRRISRHLEARFNGTSLS